MKFIRKHRQLSFIILFGLILFLSVTAIFGRYIRNIIHNYILETQGFYFRSTTLNVNGKNLSLTNWDGFTPYPITIDLQNYKTEEIYTTSDIEYDIEISCPSTVTCALSKTEGLIHPEDLTDSYSIIITPVSNFESGDSFSFTTTVTSTAPYRKVMSATYTVSVETKDFSYEIIDSPGSKYLTLNCTNALSYYIVQTAFGGHAAGERIGIDDYNVLSATDQAKCKSAIVKLSYDPHDIFLDMSNKYYLARRNTDYHEMSIGGYQWVSGFAYSMNASSSSSIIFYKNNISQDYSYPNNGGTAIIQVTPDLANS